jgi:hypothetical protein
MSPKVPLMALRSAQIRGFPMTADITERGLSASFSYITSQSANGFGTPKRDF